MLFLVYIKTRFHSTYWCEVLMVGRWHCSCRCLQSHFHIVCDNFSIASYLFFISSSNVFTGGLV